MLLQGKTQSSVPEIKAGDLGAVAKLKDTLTNDTLGDKSDGIAFPAVKFPEPVLAYAIEPKSRGDEDKISTSMHRLEEEDPSIRYSRDPQTKELLLAGQGLDISTCRAGRHQSAVPVAVARSAGDRAIADQRTQPLRGHGAARPRPLIATVAGLTDLGGIDAEEPDALRADPERVAVMHLRWPPHQRRRNPVGRHLAATPRAAGRKRRQQHRQRRHAPPSLAGSRHFHGLRRLRPRHTTPVVRRID